MIAEPPLLRLQPPLHGAELANMAGDYSYLSSGYYRSLDAELQGLKVMPTTEAALDAYVVPIAMEKARASDLPVPEFHLAAARFPPPPFMAYPVNPFSSKAELVADRAQLAARRNGLTYTGKYAVLCQELPEDCRIDVLRSVLGRTPVPEYADFAEAVFAAFRVPLARVRVIVTPKAFLFSALLPLRLEQLTAAERALAEEAGTWLD